MRSARAHYGLHMTVGPEEFAGALGALAGGVTIVCVRDGDDDVGITTTAFTAVSADPPLVAVWVNVGSYVAEVLERAAGLAVTILAAEQRAVAGRFAAAGRPSARLLLADLPHHRGAASDALVVEGGLAAVEGAVRSRTPAGDHVLVVAEVVRVDYVRAGGEPLVNFRGRYR